MRPDDRRRVDYDAIADLYDSQPHRRKEPDQDLLSFAAARPAGAGPLAVLDIGCGTGEQLVVNQPFVRDAMLVGVDPFVGMLRHARRKRPDLRWVRAEGERLPFRDAAFDYVTSQYQLHHVRDKAAMAREVARILRPGGRFVMTNIAPRRMPKWPCYRFFPGTFEQDLADFLPDEATVELLREAGLPEVRLEGQHIPYRRDLREYAIEARRRDACSQLLTIPDADYERGLRAIERAITESGPRAAPMECEVYTVKIVADR